MHLTLKEVKDRYISSVLRHTKTLKHAAQILGVDTTTLYRWHRKRHLSYRVRREPVKPNQQ